MSRIIKISELKKFDVFKTDNCDLMYIVFDDGFCCTWNQAYQFRINSFCGEVELLGQMKFIEQEQLDGLKKTFAVNN